MDISNKPTFQILKNRIVEFESVARTDEEKLQVLELKKKIHDLSTIADRYNKIFTDRGWVAHESFSIPLMEKAIKISKEKNIDIAENSIVEYYDDKVIMNGIATLWGVSSFRNRLHIIKLAYEDFICGRYHACIPVLLMMIDGVVADAGNNSGFFSEKSDVTSWDSIAGHESGLQKLKLIYYKSRSVTNNNKITLPYRNGILHGRDLGHSNRIVAVKCWSLLFVIRDVLEAQRDENIRKEKYEIEKNKSVYDLKKEIDNLHNQLHEVINMDSFKREIIIIGKDIPENGDVEEYKINSPERRLVEFIELWKAKNYGKMAILIYRSESCTKSQMAGRMNKTFRGKDIVNFNISKVNDISSCITEIDVIVSVTYDSNISQEYDVTFRLLYCKENSTDLEVNPSKVGEWKIVENFYLIKQIGTPLDYI